MCERKKKLRRKDFYSRCSRTRRRSEKGKDVENETRMLPLATQLACFLARAYMKETRTHRFTSILLCTLMNFAQSLHLTSGCVSVIITIYVYIYTRPAQRNAETWFIMISGCQPLVLVKNHGLHDVALSITYIIFYIKVMHVVTCPMRCNLRDKGSPARAIGHTRWHDPERSDYRCEITRE